MIMIWICDWVLTSMKQNIKWVSCNIAYSLIITVDSQLCRMYDAIGAILYHTCEISVVRSCHFGDAQRTAKLVVLSNSNRIWDFIVGPMHFRIKYMRSYRVWRRQWYIIFHPCERERQIADTNDALYAGAFARINIACKLKRCYFWWYWIRSRYRSYCVCAFVCLQVHKTCNIQS